MLSLTCSRLIRKFVGKDILSLLPPELALHVLTLLCPTPIALRSGAAISFSAPVSPGRSSLLISESDSDPHEALRALLSCRLVSRKWCRLASDNGIWRTLFLCRWNIDLRRAAGFDMRTPGRMRTIRMTLGKTWDFDLVEVGPKAKRVLGLPTPVCDAPIISAPLRLDWRILYRERLELDKRWAGTHRVPTYVDNPQPGASTRRMGGVYDGTNLDAMSSISGTAKPGAFEPTLTKISGHVDRYDILLFLFSGPLRP